MNLMELFRSDRAPAISLNAKEIAVLEVIRRNEPTGICVADVFTAITSEAGHEPRLATLYAAVSDLERKGLVTSDSMSSADSGGRPRRLFKLTETGRLAHSVGEAMANQALAPQPA